MPEIKWKIKNIRDQIAVIDGKLSPNIVLKNARYLHSMFKKWMTGNIWVFGDRIVYVGEEMPQNLEGAEVIDVAGKTIVPGYIEPHVHPYQLYNPHSFAQFAAQTGTTTFLSDNMSFVLLLKNKKAFSLIEQLNQLPFSFYWWSRFDSQTELEHDEEFFSNESVLEWLDRHDVLLGGELTGWPKVLRGDDQMLYWIQAAKHKGKKIEGHFPGASERTLVKMRLLGADGDHEAMTADEVIDRIQHGIKVTLRHSSIRPDLPNLLKGILEKEVNIFDHLMMTTDGATPSFYEDGIMDKCIQVAIDAGVNPIDAYQMASYNIARYYNMASLHGMIATGRFATINILKDEFTPQPESVLSKGVWLKRDGEQVYTFPEVDWSIIEPLNLDFDLNDDDFQFSMPMGIELVNDVITKPFSAKIPAHRKELPLGKEESYLMLVDRRGKWRVNTIIRGFDTHVKGFASSYSTTGDIILIGKNIEDMKQAFNEIKKINGGIVLVENGEIVVNLPLTIAGTMYDGKVEHIIAIEAKLKEALRERGYRHTDAIYTLFFLQSTHLPYIRLTPRGIFDVMKNTVMLPSVMR